MEQEITFGVKLLNGFLGITVIALVGVLISVALCLILWSVGIL
ncbi:hypothetical protein [uncultured Maribacter sp.]|nr:hypothetical protein [uncultured Maribacter sp.]